jgi:hypothetical protein
MVQEDGRTEREEGAAVTNLRLAALHADAQQLDMAPTAALPAVFGVVMDTTYPSGVVTLVAFADGATSLYTSTGFGIIGGGAHSQVVQAGRALLELAEAHRAAFDADPSDAPPPAGSVTIHLLTHTGRLATTEDEQHLGEGRSHLSPVFHAAHGVIAELYAIHDAATGSG